MYSVIYAEDNADLRRVCAFRLRETGYAVTEVESGQEALALLSVERFDAMVLDLSMPRGSGLDVLRTRAQRPSLRDIPVLVYSNDLASREEALVLGANAFFLKGDFEELLTKLWEMTALS